MKVKKLKRNIFQRILGIPATVKLSSPEAWSVDGRQLVVDLAKAPELSNPQGAARIEGASCPERLLVFRGEDQAWHAYRNRCGHAGRRMDPVPGTETIQCCSVNSATYGYGCDKLDGPGKKPVVAYEVEEKEGKLYIALS